MSDSPTVLVVEDDEGVRRGICDALDLSGYKVLSAKDGREGMEKALSERYHLLMLDIVMPYHSGFEILEEIKKSRPGQAVIVLSAKGEERDRVRGLTMGADDYVVKPFSVREMLARVDAVLRRTNERVSVTGKRSFSSGELDFDASLICYSCGETVELSEKENELLHYLTVNSTRVVTRDEILKEVWGLDPRAVSTRTIDMHVANLRSKLNDSSQELLETVRGKGYRFNLS